MLARDRISFYHNQLMKYLGISILVVACTPLTFASPSAEGRPPSLQALIQRQASSFDKAEAVKRGLKAEGKCLGTEAIPMEANVKRKDTAVEDGDAHVARDAPTPEPATPRLKRQQKRAPAPEPYRVLIELTKSRDPNAPAPTYSFHHLTLESLSPVASVYGEGLCPGHGLAPIPFPTSSQMTENAVAPAPGTLKKLGQHRGESVPSAKGDDDGPRRV